METFPNLKTVMMVEEVLKKRSKPITVSALKKTLSKKVNHNTLKIILEYLDESGKIELTMDGIVWTHKPRFQEQEISKNVKKKTITCPDCKRRHVDYGRYGKMNHRKHLCEYCRKYFYDTERGVGV